MFQCFTLLAYPSMVFSDPLVTSVFMATRSNTLWGGFLLFIGV